jgi:membrane protein
MGLLKRTVSEFFADGAMTYAAALAYYGALSLAPLLLIFLWIASLVGPNAQQALVNEAVTAMGEEVGGILTTIIANAHEKPSLADVSGIIGLGVLLFSAASVFVQLQRALNRIWDVEARPHAGIWNTVRKRLVSFGIVLILGIMLGTSLAVGSVLSVGLSVFGAGAEFFRILNEAVIFVVLAAFLVLIFKYLPDVMVSWRDVWLGAVVTAVLLTLGKFLIGLYLGHSSIGSTYGAAGSVVLLLVWAYYSGIILLFGAEFTQVWARHSGRRIMPDEHARRIHSGRSDQPTRQEPPPQGQKPPPASQGPPQHPPPDSKPDDGEARYSSLPAWRPAGAGSKRAGVQGEFSPGRLLLAATWLVPLLIGAVLLGRRLPQRRAAPGKK